ncbi:MAG: hypothetical protein WC732_02785 [Candidatus Omnitrophota bacterium]
MKTKKRDGIDRDPEDRDSLYKRYLFWLYKNVREECDRVDRKFTQLDIDGEIADFFERSLVSLSEREREEIAPFVKEWNSYVVQKKDDAGQMKFTPAQGLKPEYVFLRLKLKAIESLIIRRLGRKGLKSFKRMQEQSALQGILQENSGRR